MRDESSLPLKRFTALAAEKELLRHRVIVVGFKQKPFVHFEIRRRERRTVPSQIFRRSYLQVVKRSLKAQKRSRHFS